MKLADKLLIGATILSIAWALILAARVPLQLCAALGPDLQSGFLEAHDAAESRRLAAEACLTIGETVRDVVLLSAAPAMVAGVLWTVLAISRWYRGAVASASASNPGLNPEPPVKGGRRRPRP